MSTSRLVPLIDFQAFSGSSLQEILRLQHPPFSSQDESFRQLHYVGRYAEELDCRSVAVERRYIDRDYMEDHSVFYSRNLHPYANSCQRIHFFRDSADVVQCRLMEVIERGLSGGKDVYSAACAAISHDLYLGFSVIKPLRGSPVGRTVLRTFPPNPTPQTGFFRDFTCTRLYKVHLGGVELSVRGLAFQQQDIGVSACATTAIWSALQQVQDHEAITSPTPAEITNLAAKYSLPFGRSMPSEGLSIDQMCQAIQAVGVAPNLFRVEDEPAAARSYLHSSIKSGISPILILSMANRGRHAVSVAGMKIRLPHTPVHMVLADGTAVDFIDDNSGDLIAIYIHDDRRGPYLRADYKTDDQGHPMLLINDRSEAWTLRVYPRSLLCAKVGSGDYL